MTNTQRRTTTGAAVGAVAGAGIAHATGGNAAVGAVAGAAVAGLGTYIWSENMERQRREMQAAAEGTGVEVTRTADNQLKLAIPSDISFNSNSAVIKPEFRSVLNRFAQSLRRNPRTQILIVGHADSSGGPHINDPLSVNRANATRKYLFSRKVVGPRIQTSGRGAREPVASNDTAAGRARNRRVEIYIAAAR